MYNTLRCGIFVQLELYRLLCAIDSVVCNGEHNEWMSLNDQIEFEGGTCMRSPPNTLMLERSGSSGHSRRKINVGRLGSKRSWFLKSPSMSNFSSLPSAEVKNAKKEHLETLIL